MNVQTQIALGDGAHGVIESDGTIVTFRDATGEPLGSVDYTSAAFAHLIIGGLNRLIGDAKAEDRLALMSRLANGEYTVGAGGGRVSDPVEKRQLEIVIGMIRAKVSGKLSDFTFDGKTGQQALRARAVAELANNERLAEATLVQARRDVEAAKALAVDIDL